MQQQHNLKTRTKLKIKKFVPFNIEKNWHQKTFLFKGVALE